MRSILVVAVILLFVGCVMPSGSSNSKSSNNDRVTDTGTDTNADTKSLWDVAKFGSSTWGD